MALAKLEIEQAITELAEQSFDASEFPFVFLEAFGNKATTIKKLRNGASNKSDIGGVLQVNHIHLKTCGVGQVPDTLTALRDSKATETKKSGRSGLRNCLGCEVSLNDTSLASVRIPMRNTT